jgi:hypothetical protein
MVDKLWRKSKKWASCTARMTQGGESPDAIRLSVSFIDSPNGVLYLCAAGNLMNIF